MAFCLRAALFSAQYPLQHGPCFGAVPAVAALEMMERDRLGFSRRRVGALDTGFHFRVPARDDQTVIGANLPDAWAWRDEAAQLGRVAVF